MAERTPQRAGRVSSLETGLAGVVRNLSPRGTIAQPGQTHWPKLAVTDYAPGTSDYPAEGSTPNTYWIKFVDATFDDSVAGMITRTVNGRQAEARALVQNIAETYIPRETLVEVWPQNGRFWTFYAGGGSPQPQLQFRNVDATTAPTWGVMQIVGVSRPRRFYNVVNGDSFATTADTLAHGLPPASQMLVGFPIGIPSTPTLKRNAIYWVKAVSTNTVSFHFSEADAIAGTSPVAFSSNRTLWLADPDDASVLLVRRPADTQWYDPTNSTTATDHTDYLGPQIYQYAVNIGDPVASGGSGVCRWFNDDRGTPTRVLWDPADYSHATAIKHPSQGDEIGPLPGSWVAKRKGLGFIVTGAQMWSDPGDEATCTVEVVPNQPNIKNVCARSERLPAMGQDYSRPLYGGNPARLVNVQTLHQNGTGGMRSLVAQAHQNNTPIGISGIPIILHEGDGQPDTDNFLGAPCHFSLARSSPVRARMCAASFSFSPLIFTPWGELPGVGASDIAKFRVMYPGLPGYVLVGVDSNVDSDGFHYGYFIADDFFRPLIARAYSRSVVGAEDYVIAHPVGFHGVVYDGGTTDYPDIRLKIYGRFPLSGLNGDVAPRINIQSGQEFLYTKFNYNQSFASAGSGQISGGYIVHSPECFDAPLGTIRPWFTAPAPPGWAICDGSAATPDMRGRYLVGADGSHGVNATGGNLTHTHTGSGSSGAGGTTRVIDAANHEPPWRGVNWIKRVN
ncbi:MAG: tail fiber protein [Planctomycetaceae bacterium]|nr:tail fiber protein [Planctomycetaceae bacterium]